MPQQLFALGLYRAVALTALELPALGAEDDASFDRVRDSWHEQGLPVPRTPDQAVISTSRILNLTTAGLGPRLQLIDALAGGADVECLGRTYWAFSRPRSWRP
jgi:hypothetical protein